MERTYPYIGHYKKIEVGIFEIGNSHDFKVKFTAPKTGKVIEDTNGTWGVGEFSDRWAEQQFTIIKGENKMKETKVKEIRQYIRRNVPNVKIPVLKVEETEEGVTVAPKLESLKRPVGVFFATNESGKINIGYSLCMVKLSKREREYSFDKAMKAIANNEIPEESKPDVFDSKEALRIAKERLEGELVLPPSIRKDFRKFVDRCQKSYANTAFENRVDTAYFKF